MTTKLQRYIADRHGVQPNAEGNLVKYDDVQELLEQIADNQSETYRLLTSGWELRKTISPEGDVTYYPECINGIDNWRKTY